MHCLSGSYPRGFMDLFPTRKKKLYVEKRIKGRRYMEEGSKIEIAVGSPGNGGLVA